MENETTLDGHLEEFKKRFLTCVFSVVVFSVLSWYISDKILLLAAGSVGKLVFFSPPEAFLIKLKTSFFAGILFASPVILYHFWRYISPALLQNEKKFWWVIPMSYLLFWSGLAFGFFLSGLSV